MPAPSTRFYRLSHDQWENTVRDLFYLPQKTGFSAQFRDDPQISGYVFDNNSLSLEVDQALWSGYQRAAADTAVLITSDPALLDLLLPPDNGDDAARALAFVEGFGQRAYRRPLAQDEVDALLAIFNAAPALYPDDDGFSAGVRFVIETVLQSPHFLYRIESSVAEADGVIPLTGWEIAQRLSYFLWDSMPDDALFAAAAAGTLTEVAEVETQARRMLTEPAAVDAVYNFHRQLLDVDKYANISPSEVFFPDAPEDLGASAQTESELFVGEIVFAQQGGYADLLTSTDTYVNADLAAIYGLQGEFGAEFQYASLNPVERRGVFTQVGFLASNATSVNPDPIHRGVFLVKRITCTNIAAPPDGVPPVPPQADDKTNRQMVEEHTEQADSVCITCHGALINPYGFPFEQYDALGAFRTIDNGLPVDPATTIPVGAEEFAVADAIDLVEVLAGSAKVHGCYLQHWIEFAHGRPDDPADKPLIERLAADSLDGASVQDLLVALVTSRPFLSRATEELP
ncbi:MAG: DUF1592 domain-containing protein [Myxococcales bacterium]|nr:DUF1592 domain-containing protein [Myxococcales bacterium]